MEDEPTRRIPPQSDPPPSRYEAERTYYEAHGAEASAGAPGEPNGMGNGTKAAMIALAALVIGLGVALALIAAEGGEEPETTTVERTTTEPATTTTATETTTAPATTTTETVTETTTETTTTTVEDGGGP